MNKKILSIFIIVIFLLSTISSVIADEDRDYYIGPAELFIDIGSDGLLKINESYNYTFDGQFNGVYRNIPLKNGESIENLKVYAEGAYTKVTKTIEDGEYKIKVYLYSNPELTKPIKDTSVVIHYNYDFKNVVKIYDDVGELQFKLWGDEWDKGVNGFTAHIQFPNDEKIKYWINPLDSQTSETWNGSILTVKSDYVYSDSYLEFRGIIPLSEFKNPIYANKIHENGYDKIVKIQEDYENNARLINTIMSFIPIILILSLLFPVYVYFRYGREPKVSYNAEYERDLPSDEPPIYVDALFSKKADVGEVSNEGIQAVIMELINDKVIKIADKEDKNLRLILPDSYDDLPDYKQRIISKLLMRYAKDNILDFKQMKEALEIEIFAKEFNKNLNEIKEDYSKMNIYPILKTYFNKKGATLFNMYAIVLTVVSFILMIISFMQTSTLSLFFITFPLFILGIIMFFIPNRIFGSWTEEGLTEFKKWNAFRKFLKDFSLLKEYPPESVAIWNKYLVYATALGDAKAVSKAMKAIGSVEEFSDVYYYYNIGGYYMFSSIITTSHQSTDSSVGGVGGGSGGGGGGAF